VFGESRPARLERRPLQRSKSITPKVTPSPLKRGALQMRGTQAEACATKHETWFTRKGRNCCGVPRRRYGAYAVLIRMRTVGVAR